MNDPAPHDPGAPETVSPRRSRRGFWLLGLVTASVAALALFLGSTGFKIVRDADLQELHPADAIVVFGAAEYAGRPSPVLRARLDHAYDLFVRKLAPVIITTGGAGADPSFSEGGVGRDYLIHRGVPERDLIAETQGSDTAQSAERVGVILRTNGMHSALAVSDEYHVFRIRRLLEREGVQVYVAPRLNSRPPGAWRRFVAVLREATSYLLWRLHIT
jgi:uncharacterized SAM-binding protein YcdF (DUF218 family)